jgi:N-acetyl-gamma-glutamyl-phosphate reductase
MANAAVIGASGYLGGELVRLISEHPQLTLSHVVSKSHAGEPTSEFLPNLPRVSVVARPGAEGIDADVAFLAEPAGEAMRVVPELLARGTRVVDLGPDYRLRDPSEYERTYGKPHTDPDHLAEAVYGLPELFGEQIRSARLVANPGCYPTATLLALAPLLRHQELASPIIIDAKSGTSGAGNALSETTHHPKAALSVTPYGTPRHRHLPEMAEVLSRLMERPPALVFVPHVVPLVRGILCSIYPSPAGGAKPDGWEELLRAAYGSTPFVHVGGTPHLGWAYGTNHCYLSVQRAGDASVVFSALDNLGKGGATQAIQNANLMFGWDESLGLARAGFGV